MSLFTLQLRGPQPRTPQEPHMTLGRMSTQAETSCPNLIKHNVSSTAIEKNTGRRVSIIQTLERLTIIPVAFHPTHLILVQVGVSKSGIGASDYVLTDAICNIAALHARHGIFGCQSKCGP